LHQILQEVYKKKYKEFRKRDQKGLLSGNIDALVRQSTKYFTKSLFSEPSIIEI